MSVTIPWKKAFLILSTYTILISLILASQRLSVDTIELGGDYRAYSTLTELVSKGVSIFSPTPHFVGRYGVIPTLQPYTPAYIYTTVLFNKLLDIPTVDLIYGVIPFAISLLLPFSIAFLRKTNNLSWKQATILFCVLVFVTDEGLFELWLYPHGQSIGIILYLFGLSYLTKKQPLKTCILFSLSALFHVINLTLIGGTVFYLVLKDRKITPNSTLLLLVPLLLSTTFVLPAIVMPMTTSDGNQTDLLSFETMSTLTDTYPNFFAPKTKTITTTKIIVYPILTPLYSGIIQACSLRTIRFFGANVTQTQLDRFQQNKMILSDIPFILVGLLYAFGIPSIAILIFLILKKEELYSTISVYSLPIILTIIYIYTGITIHPERFVPYIAYYSAPFLATVSSKYTRLLYPIIGLGILRGIIYSTILIMTGGF